MCKDTHTGVCLNVNPSRAGGAYGYVDMGGWIGGQAEYVLVPYADFNLLKFRSRSGHGEDPRSDLPVRHSAHRLSRCGERGREAGPTVYIAGGPGRDGGGRPARLLGAAVTIVGDMNAERLAHARAMGFETVDLSKDASLGEQIEQILGVPEIDCAVDCVG